MSLCPWRVSATYPIGGRNFQRLTINTQTQKIQFLIMLCINVSTNQFNLRLPQSLKWDRHWIPQGNLTGSIHMTYRGKMIYTHTQTENNRAYISEKHSSKTWWAGEAGYVEQYSISISLQFFIFPMKRHQLEEYTGLLHYKLANNAEHHKKNLDMYLCFCFVCF